MGLPEIFLEHRKGEKVQKYLRVEPQRSLFVIGSSPEADLRLTGEGVVGIHAVLRYREPNWYVSDVSGTGSLRVDGLTVVEALVNESTRVEIAGHRLNLFKKNRDSAIFKDTQASGPLELHQVVVRLKGRVVQTHVLKATEPFVMKSGDQPAILPPPADGSWKRTELGMRVVEQRLVSAQEIVAGEKIEFDQDLRKPFIIALMFFLIMGSMVAFFGSRKDGAKPEVALDKKSMDIIFNAKAVKKKKLEAQKVTKSAKSRAGGTNEANARQESRSMPEVSTGPTSSAKATAALTSLRNSGLSNLVGKIAKRANKQGVLVAAQGVSPDSHGSGRAFFSTGTSTVGGGGTASKPGTTYRLGGVATGGKAGGAGNFKEGTGLVGGSVGTGNVMALSDDEETVIDGGLDRDAIAEVIKRNIGQIRYCYERQLSSNPDLYGKVLVKFTIGANGGVSGQRVDNTTLKSAMVEGCILRRMAAWKFPLPKGGTEVRVSYPFLFKAMD